MRGEIEAVIAAIETLGAKRYVRINQSNPKVPRVAKEKTGYVPHPKIPVLPNDEELKGLLEKLTMREIAAQYGCTYQWVSLHCKLTGITNKRRGRPITGKKPTRDLCSCGKYKSITSALCMNCRSIARIEAQRVRNEQTEKKCTRCKLTKPIERFGVQRRIGREVAGRYPRCKRCLSDIGKINRLKEKANAS